MRAVSTPLLEAVSLAVAATRHGGSSASAS
jgi:hypothetical protein